MGPPRDLGANDDGFTILELMVVVLIIAILLAIAVPSFLGARNTANDRAAQSNLRNAHTNALVYYADRQEYTQDTAVLSALDASLGYTNTLSLTVASVVYVEVPASGTYTALDTIYLGARSKAGQCFWIRTIGTSPEPRFSKNDCSGRPGDLSFAESW